IQRRALGGVLRITLITLRKALRRVLRKWIVEGLRKTQPKREKNKYSKRQQLSHDGLKNPIVPNDRGQTLAILPSARCDGHGKTEG
ncbi:MAG: hypothetical protein WB776_10330, partial [Candidatus Sulfotelmatobacter sp.]